MNARRSVAARVFLLRSQSYGGRAATRRQVEGLPYLRLSGLEPLAVG